MHKSKPLGGLVGFEESTPEGNDDLDGLLLGMDDVGVVGLYESKPLGEFVGLEERTPEGNGDLDGLLLGIYDVGVVGLYESKPLGEFVGLEERTPEGNWDLDGLLLGMDEVVGPAQSTKQVPGQVKRRTRQGRMGLFMMFVTIAMMISD